MPKTATGGPASVTFLAQSYEWKVRRHRNPVAAPFRSRDLWAHPEFLKQSNHRERFHWRWDTPEKYQQNMRSYFRMLTGIDHVMDRVLKALEQAGLAENTIIVYTADNGYYMGDRGFAGKWSHHEQSLRVPLVIYDPRLPKNLRGRTVDAMASIWICRQLSWTGAESAFRQATKESVSNP